MRWTTLYGGCLLLKAYTCSQGGSESPSHCPQLLLCALEPSLPPLVRYLPSLPPLQNRQPWILSVECWVSLQRISSACRKSYYLKCPSLVIVLWETNCLVSVSLWHTFTLLALSFSFLPLFFQPFTSTNRRSRCVNILKNNLREHPKS